MAKRRYDTEEWTEQAAPATPASGFARLYIDTNGELHVLNDSGVNQNVCARSRFYAAALASGSPTATVTHNFNLANIHDFICRVIVSATGVEEEYESVGATANTITITDETGANIATGRRVFVVAGV